MKTKHIRQGEPAWHIIDAESQVVGRLATKIADLLRGKSKPEFVLNMDCGDHVVVINADKVIFTGAKWDDKKYYHHTRFPGGLKEITARRALETKPEFILENAVKGMLPKNKLQNEWMKRLHVYAGTEHPHQANVANLTAK